MTPTDVDPKALLASAATFRTESVRIAASRYREALRASQRASEASSPVTLACVASDERAARESLTRAMRGGGR